MDTAQIRREFVASLRLLVTGERRLLGGAVAVAVAYAVWVGATGAALNFGLDFGDRATSAAAWQATGTATVVLVVVLWVLVPAAVVTFLVDRAVTNANGNVRQHYRFTHPFLLVAPYLLLAVGGIGAAVALGEATAALLGVASALGLFALVRTVPASYRVFSFSHPRLAEALLFLALCVDAVAIPVSAATLTGRGGIVDAAASGLAGKVGTSTVETALVGATTVADVTVPYLLGATALVPVALVGMYFAVQVVAAQVNRTRSPDVPRSELRTGQRYPEFARPMHGNSGRSKSGSKSAGNQSDSEQSGSSTTPAASTGAATATASGAGQSASASAASSSGAGGGASAGTATASKGTTGGDDSTEPADDGNDEADDDEYDERSHTRVFKPPSGGGFGAGDGDDASGGKDGTDADGGYRCPSCGDRYGADASFDYCPTCGSELQAE